MPKKAPPGGRYGLQLLLHSLGAGYNQFSGSRNQSQFGDRGRGYLVMTPAGRGPDGWYYDRAGADTFEVWADVARHYALDPAFTSIAGYSMGGYGTYKFATSFPDLFARAQPTVGPPGLGVWVPPNPPEPGGARSNTNRQLASVRHIPFLIWNASSDQLVPLPGPQAQADAFDALGYRYEFDVFSPAEHLTLAINDQFAPAAAFLGDAQVKRDPAHVTFVRNPTMDFGDAGTVADHAYWLSAIGVRSGTGDAALGTVDAESGGIPEADAPATPTARGGGSLDGGHVRVLGVHVAGADVGRGAGEGGRGRAVGARAQHRDRDGRPGAGAGELRRVAAGRHRRAGAGGVRGLRADRGVLRGGDVHADRCRRVRAGGRVPAGRGAAALRATGRRRARGVHAGVRARWRGSTCCATRAGDGSPRGRGSCGGSAFARARSRGARAGCARASTRCGCGSAARAAAVDERRVVLQRRGGRFVRRRAYVKRVDCRVLSRFALSGPVFGGRTLRRLAVRYRLARGARARVDLLRRGHVVRRLSRLRRVPAGRTRTIRVRPRTLARGAYRVRLTVRSGGGKARRMTLTARRL